MSKIICVNWNFQGENLGGQETFFSMISKIFNAKKVSYDRVENVYRKNLFSDPYKIVYRGYAIERYLSDYETLFKPDLIIKNSAIGGFIKIKTPQIVVFQDPFYSLLKGMIKRGFFMGSCDHYSSCINLMRASSKGSTTVAVSNFMKKDMGECGIKCDKVIEEGIDIEKFKPINKKELREKYGIPLDKKVGIAVTKVIPQKGWDILANLINKFKDIHWIVVLTNKVDGKPKLKNVSLFKEVDPSLMPELYNASDFCISTSIVESFGLVTLEASACDVPIITYKTGWAWDWWDKRLGLRVDAWDSPSFENAINNLFSKGHMKYEPRRAVVDRGFTKEVVEKNWKEFVRKLLNNQST